METLALLSSLITIQIAFLETDLRMLSGCDNEHVRTEIIRRKTASIISLLEVLETAHSFLLEAIDFEIDTSFKDSSKVLHILKKNKESATGLQETYNQALGEHILLTRILTSAKERVATQVNTQMETLKKALEKVLLDFQTYPT